MKRAKVYFLLTCLCALVFSLAQCGEENQFAQEKSPWINHHDSVYYVGIETCKACHADMYETYIHTGMGQSFDLAHPGKSAAHFHQHPPIYDSLFSFFYSPQWRGDSLFISEYRIDEKGDTTHHIQQYIDYIIGSGQHTNSHLFQQNGYVYQAPFTYYTQSKRLDLPPGYEAGSNSRFDRIIGLECMSCHNAMPTGFVAGSENKFTDIARGIDCERCHGPGSAHVAKINRGEITDTANDTDYSIVNPAKLSPQLRMEICQRCHLQGNAVLTNGHSFLDFRPGMMLSDIMDVYIPRYEGKDHDFIMASHVDRFKMSTCFQSNPEEFTCTTCHNPHKSVKITGDNVFNASCKNCHKGSVHSICSENPEKIDAQSANCVSCHMPASGSIDIPHVYVHDHFIRKDYLPKDNQKQSRFLGLEAINNKNPSPESKITAYLQQYEKFGGERYLLDSADKLLQKIPFGELANLRIHLYFLQEKYVELTKYIDEEQPAIVDGKIATSLDNAGAWTAYRIAEGMNKQGRLEEALSYYKRAVEAAPLIPDIQVKYATALAKNNQSSKAIQYLQEVTRSQPYNPQAWSNLGYLCWKSEDKNLRKQALPYLSKAIEYDPDYPPAYYNKIEIFLEIEAYEEASAVLDKLLKIAPHDSQAHQLKKWLISRSFQ